MEVIESIDICDQLCSNATFSDAFTKKNVGFVFAKGNNPIYTTITDGKVILDKATYIKIGVFIQKSIAQCSLACLGKLAKTATGIAFAQGDKEKIVFLYHYKLKRKGDHVQVTPVDIPSYDEFKSLIITAGRKGIEFSD
jgi:hypothetical protein